MIPLAKRLSVSPISPNSTTDVDNNRKNTAYTHRSLLERIDYSPPAPMIVPPLSLRLAPPLDNLHMPLDSRIIA